VQINRPSPERLEITHVPWGLWMVSAFLGIVGAFVLFVVAIDVSFVGVAVGLGWLAGAWFTSPLGTGLRHTWEFDRQQGRVIISRQWVFKGLQVEHVPLAEIKQATLQRSSGRKSRSTYRVALELKKGREIPLSEWYSNTDVSGKRQAVAAIQDFLKLRSAKPEADAGALFQEGFQQYWQAPPGRKGDAADRFRQVVQERPGDLAAWLYLADATKDPLERRAALERVIALDLNGPFGKRASAALASLNAMMPNGPAATGETVPLTAASFGPEPNVALPPVPGQVSVPLHELLFGALMLRPATYKIIAHDPTLTVVSGLLVFTIGLVTGFFGGLYPLGTTTINGQTIEPGLGYAGLNMFVRGFADLAGWFIGASLCATIAAQFFRGLTNRAEMLRVFGFTSLFKLMSIYPPLIVPALALSAVAVVTAVREAAEFDTGRAIATAVISTMLAGFFSTIINLTLTGIFLVPFSL
jgi:hypothetical protein